MSSLSINTLTNSKEQVQLNANLNLDYSNDSGDTDIGKTKDLASDAVIEDPPPDYITDEDYEQTNSFSHVGIDVEMIFCSDSNNDVRGGDESIEKNSSVKEISNVNPCLVVDSFQCEKIYGTSSEVTTTKAEVHVATSSVPLAAVKNTTLQPSSTRRLGLKESTKSHWGRLRSGHFKNNRHHMKRTLSQTARVSICSSVESLSHDQNSGIVLRDSKTHSRSRYKTLVMSSLNLLCCFCFAAAAPIGTPQRSSSHSICSTTPHAAPQNSNAVSCKNSSTFCSSSVSPSLKSSLNCKRLSGSADMHKELLNVDSFSEQQKVLECSTPIATKTIFAQTPVATSSFVSRTSEIQVSSASGADVDENDNHSVNNVNNKNFTKLTINTVLAGAQFYTPGKHNAFPNASSEPSLDPLQDNSVKDHQSANSKLSSTAVLRHRAFPNSEIATTSSDNMVDSAKDGCTDSSAAGLFVPTAGTEIIRDEDSGSRVIVADVDSAETSSTSSVKTSETNKNHRISRESSRGSSRIRYSPRITSLSCGSTNVQVEQTSVQVPKRVQQAQNAPTESSLVSTPSIITQVARSTASTNSQASNSGRSNTLYSADYLRDSHAMTVDQCRRLLVPQSLLGKEESQLLPSYEERETPRKCLVLDLDETLVHSSFQYVPNADFVVPVTIGGQVQDVYVLKRPGVDEFMKKMGEIYEIVIFTASLSLYADAVIDLLDIHNVVKHRLFRESCVMYQGSFVKNLSFLGRDLHSVAIVDNSQFSYAFHLANAIPILTWFDDPTDVELLKLGDMLIDMSVSEDFEQFLAEKRKQGILSERSGW